ncbi:EF hand domain-containing protein [Shimia isoporae]|uniref:EF hand domain-containing protein n=1 Tax=Shimia isoporae TaxID=647720 RepID=A0A4R1N2F2_9RHOB|nr:hypothetical protein [Shimia isoporae]TCL00388.1 EF hand domain-containing protein [Shimia isoporae]
MKPTLIAASIIAGVLALPAHAEDLSKWEFGINGNLTWDDVQSLRIKIFETFDADGDGALNSEEYTTFDKARREAANNTDSSFLLRSVDGMSRQYMDANLDGKVTRAEMDQALNTWFASVDKDADGIITKGNF